MSAYVVVEIDVKDPVGYEEYKNLASPTIAEHGGKYLVRGGRVEILEGDWSPKRFVILEFDSMDQAKRWWSSEQYKDAKSIRHKTAHTQMIVVEGM
jgi:uncharacterized protein (DUF1330 family)